MTLSNHLDTVFKKNNARQIFMINDVNFIDRIGEFFVGLSNDLYVEGNIVHLLQGNYLPRASNQYTNFSFAQKVAKVYSMTIGGYIKMALVSSVIQRVIEMTEMFDAKPTSQFIEPIENASFYDKLVMHIISPVMEEIENRLIFQNAIGILQGLAKNSAPNLYKNNRAFKWLLSTPSRILLANTYFALRHLGNAKNQGMRSAAAQTMAIALNPEFSILYEVTGNIIPCMASHILHNLIARKFVL